MAKSELSFNEILSNEYAAREAVRTDKFDPDNLDDPIPPPPPPPAESIEQFRERIERLFPELPSPDSPTVRHAIVRKLMAYDSMLAAMKKRGGYHEPQYQDMKGKLYLEWLNFLLHSFERLGFQVKVRGRKFFKFEVIIQGDIREFVIAINESHPTYYQRKYKPKDVTRKYFFRWERDFDYYRRDRNSYEFDTMTVAGVRKIIVDYVVYEENQYRSGIIGNYERNIEWRNRNLQRIEDEKARIAEQKRRALEQAISRRQSLINDAVDGMNRADQLRELIKIVQAKSESAKTPIKNLDRWIRWATYQADSLDPRHMSVKGFEAWIEKFKLKH